jgi:hypothetical protein
LQECDDEEVDVGYFAELNHQTLAQEVIPCEFGRADSVVFEWIQLLVTPNVDLSLIVSLLLGLILF